MTHVSAPPAIVHVEPDMPGANRSPIQVEAEKLQRQLKATVAHTTVLAERGKEQARRISTVEERTRETLRELITSLGPRDGGDNKR